MRSCRTAAFLLFLLALAATLLLASPAGVAAQEPTPSDDEVNDIARELFCPVCENTPLDVCPTEACRQWRDLIRQMLTEGRSAGEIQQYFVDNYGARVLSKPPRAGFNWLAYLVPPVAFLAGVALLGRAFVLWRRAARDPQPAVPTSPPDGRAQARDEYIDRLEEELRKRD